MNKKGKSIKLHLFQLRFRKLSAKTKQRSFKRILNSSSISEISRDGDRSFYYKYGGIL